MSQDIIPGASAPAFSLLTATLDLDRHGKPLATLTSRPFNDVEMNAAQLRRLAGLLIRLAEATEGHAGSKLTRRVMTLTAEEAQS
jgi:hypothetical protein